MSSCFLLIEAVWIRTVKSNVSIALEGALGGRQQCRLKVSRLGYAQNTLAGILRGGKDEGNEKRRKWKVKMRGRKEKKRGRKGERERNERGKEEEREREKRKERGKEGKKKRKGKGKKRRGRGKEEEGKRNQKGKEKEKQEGKKRKSAVIIQIKQAKELRGSRETQVKKTIAIERYTWQPRRYDTTIARETRPAPRASDDVIL